MGLFSKDSFIVWQHDHAKRAADRKRRQKADRERERRARAKKARR